jgi:hypothetical protein
MLITAPLAGTAIATTITSANDKTKQNRTEPIAETTFARIANANWGDGKCKLPDCNSEI